MGKNETNHTAKEITFRLGSLYTINNMKFYNIIQNKTKNYALYYSYLSFHRIYSR